MPKDEIVKSKATEKQQQEATNEATEAKATGTSVTAGADPKSNSEGKIDSNKLAEKLQARLTKEQADKNEYKDKYQSAVKELERLKAGKKSVKELHDADQNQQALAAKDKEIKKLQSQIKRSETLKQVDGIFKDADLRVSDDVLGLVVSDDNEKTVANAKAIIDLVNKSYENGRKTILKGKTPKADGNSAENAIKKALGL